MPDLLRLLGQRLDQMRMRMAAACDRNAGAEIQIGFTLGREDAHALAPLESRFGAIVGGKNGSDHRRRPWSKAKCAAQGTAQQYFCYTISA